MGTSVADFRYRICNCINAKISLDTSDENPHKTVVASAVNKELAQGKLLRW